jgi:CubicO group peptidase (beta-lactamase class C family)
MMRHRSKGAVVDQPMIELAPGREVRPLIPMGIDPASVTGLPVATDRWGATTVGEVLGRHDACGLVVAHRGRLAIEWYGDHGDASRPNLCFSITKSFTGTLAALAVHGGALDRSAVVGDILPELVTSGFGDATVGQIADMTVSIAYDEDYDDAESGASSADAVSLGFGDYMAAIGLASPSSDAPGGSRGVRGLLGSVARRPGAHGEVFAYGTPVTDVLAWLLERSLDVGYLDQLREGLWAHVGAESPALLLTDPAGTPLAGGGLQVTTRDLARFGLLLVDGGSGGHDAVVPAPVLDAIRSGGDRRAFERSHYSQLTGYTYRDQWWMPPGPSRPLSAWGIHGQLLWVEPDLELVVACHCVSAVASDERRDAEQDAMCRAIADAAREW